MGSIYAEDVVNLALSYVGYTEGPNNWNIFAQELDSVDYFIGCGKKQNLPWCCVFCNDMLFKASTADSPSGKKWDAINFQYQSSSCNTSAVVSYYENFFKRAGELYAHPEVGDICFYGDSHVGIVVSVDGSYMTVVEGNASNKVMKKFRPISDSGEFGRPSYDKKPDPKPGQHYPGEYPVRPSRGYFQRYDEGPEVVKLQKLFDWISPGCLPKFGCDGQIGDETLGACRLIQSIVGAKVDGFYGSETETKCRNFTK